MNFLAYFRDLRIVLMLSCGLAVSLHPTMAVGGELLQVDGGSERTYLLYEGRGGKGDLKAELGPGDVISYEKDKSDLRIPAYDRNGEDISLFLEPSAFDSGEIGTIRPGTRVYVNLPPGESMGLERNANDDPTLAAMRKPLGSVDANSEIVVLETAFAEKYDDRTGDYVYRNMYRVTLFKPDGTEVEGWIDGGFISDRPRMVEPETPPRKPLEITITPKEPCPEKKTVFQESIETIGKITDKVIEFGFGSASDEIVKHVGACIGKPNSVASAELRRQVVEQYAGAELPTVKKADGTNMTNSDWATIDVMARTLYGEMLGFKGECFERGDQYPRAVAKIILNRKDMVNSSNSELKFAARGRFLVDDAPKDFPQAVRLMISPTQFNLWDDSKPSRMALCPPASAKKKFYTGARPSKKELKWWKQAVRVATEAVLDEEGFKKRTKDLDAVYYTSNMKRGKGFSRVHTTVGGKKIDHNRCLMIWEEDGLEAVRNRAKKKQ